jgi:pimeloyl-ACP methyl ester carboxylesterase
VVVLPGWSGSITDLDRLRRELAAGFRVIAVAHLAEAYGADQARTMASSWSGAMGAIIDAGGDISRSRAQHITCPALLIAGTDDPFCPPTLVRAMADAMPRATYLEVPGAGHDLHLSHSDWLASTITSWLSDH